MMTDSFDPTTISSLRAELVRIADALERLAPPPPVLAAEQLDDADAWIWNGSTRCLDPVERVNRIDLSLLSGIDANKQRLYTNTKRFALGFAANNALLWGARGMGKSSLVKAVHGTLLAKGYKRLRLIEINREEIGTLPVLMDLLRDIEGYRVILFCDDLSFEAGDDGYKSLKAVLEGGLAGRPSHILFYATSNRRHMLPRDMIDNEQATAINPGEAGEEKTSLSERFGLWIGFHSCSQEAYLEMVGRYISHYNLPVSESEWGVEALSWSHLRGRRSGRIAWQFIQDLAGRLGQSIE